MKRKRTTRNSLKASYFSSQQQQQLSETTSLHLPDDCWESICTFLIDHNDNHRYLKPLSLASKHFLSITNRLRSSFTIIDPTFPFIPTLFHRFPNLTSLHVTTYFQADLNTPLCHISKFPFKLKSLSLEIPYKCSFPAKGLLALSKKITTLTSLTCSGIAIDDPLNNHFVFISDCFPLLEELHLKVRKSVSGIQDGVNPMLMVLPKLRKINYIHMNDSLLLNLCKNCEFLENIEMTCSRDGVASAIRERPSLTSLSIRLLSNENHVDDIISSHFIDSLVSLKGLTCLHLWSTQISDELLSAMGDLPLRRLVLKNCTGYSYVGIFNLLSKCQRIQHLDLQKVEFLNDQNVVTLSMFLGDLISINLSECKMLTKLAFFALVRKCPLLSEIKMERIGRHVRYSSVEKSDSLKDFGVYPQLKSLHLAYNTWLRDEHINTFDFIFPNLQLLDLYSCNRISEEAIVHVLRKCCKIRHLNLSRVLQSLRIKSMNFNVMTLEVLNLSKTGIDDTSLYMISKICLGLLQLELALCNDVTEKGVMQVVENCTQLREINLRGCPKVAADVVDSMLFIRPSLRKIMAPHYFICTQSRMKQYLRNGCFVQHSWW